MFSSVNAFAAFFCSLSNMYESITAEQTAAMGSFVVSHIHGDVELMVVLAWEASVTIGAQWRYLHLRMCDLLA
jgi:hypothetical protein